MHHNVIFAGIFECELMTICSCLVSDVTSGYIHAEGQIWTAYIKQMAQTK